MPPLIAGSTLTDLSRNSLIEDEGRRADFQNALALMAQRRNLGAQLLMQQDLANREDARFGQEIGARERIAMAPWDRGMTPMESARNSLATRELEDRTRVSMDDLAFKRMNAMLPYQRMTAAQAAEAEARHRLLGANESLIQGQADYYRNGGRTAWQLEKEKMDQGAQRETLANAAAAYAANANMLLDGELGAIDKKVSDSMASWLGWGNGFTGANAGIVGSQIAQRSPKLMLGTEDVTLNPRVVQARGLRNQLVSEAGARTLAALGEEANSLIRMDPATGRFVPNFGSAPQQATPQAGAMLSQPAPTTTGTNAVGARAIRGPDGKLRMVTPVGPTVAPMGIGGSLVSQDAQAVDPDVELLQRTREAFANANARSEGSLRDRLLEEVARRNGLEPLVAWDRMGASTLRKHYNLTPAQRVARQSDYYDQWLQGLPPMQQVEILNAAMGSNP